MYYEVYLDVVFIINFILDFIIVKITGYIAKKKSTLFRCIVSAGISSCILCLVYIYFMEFLVRYYFVMMLIMNLATVILVFYHKKSKMYEIISVLAIYYMVSFMLGGIINVICTNVVKGIYLFSVPWWSVLLISTTCFLGIKPVIAFMERRKETKSIYYDVELCIEEKRVRIKGLLDTGNHLFEPVSGKPVQVAEILAVRDLFEEKFLLAVKRYYENGMVEAGLYLERGIRVVPFRAVGTPREKLLVAVEADVMEIKNEQAEYIGRNVYVALYNGKLAGDSSYQMLLNSKEFIRERG